jgi:signal transduction histidine kinase/HAMP domain-containing protein
LRALRSLPIRVQLTIVLVLLVLTLTGLLASVSYRAAVRSLQEEGTASLREMAATREDAINTALIHKRERIASAIQSVQLSCDVVGRLERWCARETLLPFFKREQILGGTLVTPNGHRFSFGEVSPLTSSVESPADLARNSRGRVLLVLTSTDRESGLTLITQAPVSDLRDLIGPERSRTALLVAGMPEDPFYVFDPSRRISMTENLRYCVAGADPTSARNEDSGSVFRVYRPVTQLAGSCIVTEEPRTSILAPAERLRSKVGKLVAISASVALILAYLLGFLLTRPLKVLQERVRKFRAGDYDSPVPIVGHGEVHDFSETFASMAESVRASRAALVESQQKLTLAYKAARLWLWSYDLRSGHITTQGPELEGRERAPKTLHAFLHQVHPHDRHMVCDALRAAKRTGLFEAEYRMRANGRELWIAGWGQLMHDQSGAPSSIVGVSVDTSSRKSAQRLETDREKLMATSNLAASLAHEINNPLTSVIGSIYLATSRVADGEVKHFLGIAGREAQRVAQIAKQMLALYRPSSMPEPVDVRRIIEVALASVNPHAQRKGIAVSADVASVGTVVGFADEFRHAIMNLLMNAIEHSPSDATVSVRAHRSRSWQNSGDRGIRVVVLNHGTALERDEIDRMFSPFVSTKAERGSGLGLWVTRAIVLKHGGRIVVRSFRHPREAVCCSIYLPARSSVAV